MVDRNGHFGGAVAVFVAIFGGGALAFWIAIATFWWCPQGGCPLRTATALWHLFVNVGGLIVLLLLWWLLLWFAAAAAFRLYYPKVVAERVFLKSTFVLPQLYERSMRRWLDLLWRRHAHDA